MFNNKGEIDALHFRLAQLEDRVHEVHRYVSGHTSLERELLEEEEERFKLLADAIGMEFQTEAATPSKTVLVKKTEENV
jgi:hypothetical protein